MGYFKNDEIACPFDEHGGIQCFKMNCEHCGWNPKVAKVRKEKINRMVLETIKARTKMKRVMGLNIRYDRLDYTPTLITVRVTKDDRGTSLSLTDDSKEIMLMIPLEGVKDMIKVVEDRR